MKTLSCFVIALSLIAPYAYAAPAVHRHVSPGNLSCADIVDNGWSKMPDDIADYVLAKPNSEKLGYGSFCHIGSLVFAQCFLEPRWLVRQAVDELINKASGGQPLPGERVCGA